jgi:hypothetical protein
VTPIQKAAWAADRQVYRNAGLLYRSHHKQVETRRRHEVGFYSDDRLFLDDVAQLLPLSRPIVATTESHRNSLLSRLQAYGLDIGTAIEQGRYVALDGC